MNHSFSSSGTSGTPVLPATSAEEQLQDKEYEFIAELVAKRAGIILKGERHRNMLYGRLIRRLRALNLPNFRSYCEMLKSDAADDELPHLINAVTTNVTAFFRENHHFEHLKGHLQSLAGTGSKKLRIWSAACSSGEEPYSIAMTVSEAIPTIASWDAKILATDIDTSMLQRASEAMYSRSFLKDLPASCVERYITETQNDQQFVMKDSIRKLIHFKQLNLLESWKMQGPFDAVFCRNVFIYFTQETVREIALRFAGLLKVGGFLYIGHSENLLNLGHVFAHEGKTMYRKIADV